MDEDREKEVVLDIPNLNWPSWETLVSAALEGIAGVRSFKVDAMRREATVVYDPGLITGDGLLTEVKKKTRYRTMSIKG